MVAQFLRLKLQLTANLFRRSPWQVAGLVVGLVYGVMIAVLAVVVLVGLRFAPVATAAPIVIVGGSLAVLGFLLVPLVLGVDDTLDPQRFALLGIERTRLAFGLAVGALLGIPAIVLSVVALASVVTWSRSPGAFLVALVGAAAGVATCVLASRISAAAAGLLLATRRSRETLTALTLLGLVLLAPLLLLVTNLGISLAGLRSLADGLAYTPLGAAWAAPATVAAGDGRGLLQLVVALATVGLLWLAWRALVGLVVTTPARQGQAQSFTGLGWFGRLPSKPGWAVAARTLTYWTRDVRYRMSLVMLPITPVLIVVPLLVINVPLPVVALVPVPVLALFLGWTAHNDVAYDNTAVWLHVASGVSGAADRLGRVFPNLLLGVPIVLVGSVVSALIADRPVLALPLIGVSSCLLLSGLGFSFVTSARFPYPVPRPGDSPFQQPNSTSGLTAAVQSVTFFGQFVIAAPALLLAGLGFLTGATGWFVASGAVGLLTGLVVFVVGLRVGARVFERRGPEMLAAALRA